LRIADCGLRIPHHSDKQIGDAWPAQIAERGELATIDTVEQHHAAPEHLALKHRLK